MRGGAGGGGCCVLMRGCLRRSMKCAGRSVWRKRRSFIPGGGSGVETTSTGAASSTMVGVWAACSVFGSRALPFFSPGAVLRCVSFSFSLIDCSPAISLSRIFFEAAAHARSGAANLCFNDLQNAAAHALQGRGVNIDPIELVSRLPHLHLLLQPDGEVIGVQLQAKPRINKVVIDGVDAHATQAVIKLLKVTRHIRRWDHHQV